MLTDGRGDAKLLPRRSVLKGAAAVMMSGPWVRLRGAPASQRAAKGGVKLRPDLLDPGTGGDLEIVQLTTDPAVPSCHVYMEAQVFTPDNRRFVFHRSAQAHGSDRKDPKHQYILCDLDDDFAMHPLTEEVGATGPSISPDGKYLYYFVDQRRKQKDSLALKRVRLDGTDRQTILMLDAGVPGTNFHPIRIYPLSTISSDGRKIAISVFLDRGTPMQCGLLVFDVEKATVQVVIHGPNWTNMHPQFCRAADTEGRRDILIQENHGDRLDADGKVMPKDDTAGADIHVIRDDGTDFRTLPWGRDGTEFCEGHQCWRGRTGWAITSAVVGQQSRLIESLPVAGGGHEGSKTPGGVRNELTRGFDDPQFHHFAVDIAGKWLISDYKWAKEARIYLARLGQAGQEPLSQFRCLARPQPSGQKTAHIHPLLSPDARMAFFNSDESGQLQAYMLRGLPG